MKLLKLLKSFVNGAVFGIAVIIPGADSGTMLVVFGCYDVFCGILSLDFKHIKKNLDFLIPFAIGGLSGFGGAVFAISYLIENYHVPMFLFFIGLIAGSFPTIISKALNKQNSMKFKPYFVIFAVIAAAAVITLNLLGGEIETTVATDTAVIAGLNLFLFIKIIVCCFIAAAAMIIPGLSGSFLLMMFGLYPTVINALRTLDFITLLPIVAGILMGLILGAKIIKWLLSRFCTLVYVIIAGLMAGSVISLFPTDIELNAALAVGIVVFIIGATFTFLCGKGENKQLAIDN